MQNLLTSLFGKPKPDDPKSKSPCSKCLGNPCLIMSKRNPKKECGAFAEKGKNVIEFRDGRKVTF
jgi:hypothetical protein